MAEELGIVTAIEVKPTGAAIIVPATGGSMRIGSTVIPVHCIGQMGAFDLAKGPVELSGSVNFIVQGDALMDLVNPDVTTKVLNTFDVTIGTYKITGCKMTNLTLNATVEDILKGSFSFMGTAWATTTNPTKPSAVPGYQSWEMGASYLGTFQANTVDITIDNGVRNVHYMGAADPGRVPQYLAEGYQSSKFNARLVLKPTIPADITADALATIATATFAFTDTSVVTKTLTITATTCLAEEVSQDHDPEDVVRYGVSYTAKSIDWAITP